MANELSANFGEHFCSGQAVRFWLKQQQQQQHSALDLNSNSSLVFKFELCKAKQYYFVRETRTQLADDNWQPIANSQSPLVRATASESERPARSCAARRVRAPVQQALRAALGSPAASRTPPPTRTTRNRSCESARRPSCLRATLLLAPAYETRTRPNEGPARRGQP